VANPAGGWPPEGRIVMTPNYYPFSVCLIMAHTWNDIHEKNPPTISVLFVDRADSHHQYSHLFYARMKCDSKMMFLFVRIAFLLRSTSAGKYGRTAWGVQGGRRRPQTPAMWAGHHWNGHNAVSGVAHLQGVERSGMPGRRETLGSPWPPLCRAPMAGKKSSNFGETFSAADAASGP
jgi:hypothetical protein